MKAVIMAGGFGTRLRPLTISVPKPMVFVANAPMMEHVVSLLRKHGMRDIISLLYYQPEAITGYFGDGSGFGVKMDYIKTDADLGTAGAVGAARNKIKRTFAVISGDVICDFDLNAAVAFHKKRKALATIVLTRVKDPLQYGIVITKKDGRISSFLEKPTWGEVFSDTINTGTYIFEPEIFDYIPPETEMDFSKNLFPLLLERKAELFGFTAPGYWKDVGNLDEYLKCHIDIMEEKIKIGLSATKKIINGFPVWIGEGTRLPKEIKVEGPVVFGRNVKVDPFATLSNCCFADDCRIGKYTKISRSVVQTGVSVGHHCDLKETVVGFSTKISDLVKTSPGVVIGDNCEVGRAATVQARIKIWPGKFIESGAFVNSSIVWGDRFSRSLFGNHGINGLANIEITPEMATRLGVAYGAKLGKGKYVITSRDASQTSRMIKRSIIAGLISMGVRVGDLRTLLIPVARYEIGKEGESGGVHVRISPFDGRVADILFFDETGCDIQPSLQKSIEQAFFKEDFPRADVNSVGEIIIPPRASQYYKEGIINSIDVSAVRRNPVKIVCDYAFSSASLVLPEILGALNVEVISLNGVLNPAKSSKSLDEFNSSLDTVSKVVRSTRADFGVMLDVGGEKLFFLDSRGRRIHSQKALLVVLELVGRSFRGGNVAIPVNAPRRCETIAGEYGLGVVPTGTTPGSIMRICKEKDVIFAADGKGGFIFPRFQPSFDGMYALCKIIEMCVTSGVNLTELASREKDPVIVRKQVYCPWEKKGFLMRKLIEETPSGKRHLVDGVKITGKNGWVLFLPDATSAKFTVCCEARTRKEAREMAGRHIKKIRNWLKSS